MPQSLPAPKDCLQGARVCYRNSRSLHRASLRLRAEDFNREAVFLLATSVEEAAKAVLLHRAWLISGEPEAFKRLMDAWESSNYNHHKKHNVAPFTTETMLPSLAVAAVVDLVTRSVPFLRAKAGDLSMISEVLKAYFGEPPAIPGGWYDRLHRQRQAMFINWRDGSWSGRDQTEAARFFDEGRRDVHRLLAGLRRDLRRTDSIADPSAFFESQ